MNVKNNHVTHTHKFYLVENAKILKLIITMEAQSDVKRNL